MATRSYNNTTNAYYLTATGGGNNNNANNSYRSLPDRSRTQAYWALEDVTPEVATGSVNPWQEPEQCGGDGVAAHGSMPVNSADIFSFGSLLRSHSKCKLGLMWKDSVASFHLNRVSRLLTIEERIENGTYGVLSANCAARFRYLNYLGCRYR